MEDFTNNTKNTKSTVLEELKSIVSQEIRTITQGGNIDDIGSGDCISSTTSDDWRNYTSFQSNGSLLTLNGKVVGSKLIAQEFKSEKFFHSRPSANSTSGVDPHISPDEAFSQITRISKATGLEENTLRTIVQLDIERNKVSNVLVFAPQYMNVLQVNLDLITAYPRIYHEFITNGQAR